MDYASPTAGSTYSQDILRGKPVYSVERNQESGIIEATIIGFQGKKDSMSPQSYQEKAKEIVFDYAKKHLAKTDVHVKFTPDDVYVVWFSKTLQNWKALVSTTLADGVYYEVTHDGARERTYLDAYKKFDNVTILDPVKTSSYEDSQLPELYLPEESDSIMMQNHERALAGLRERTAESEPYSEAHVKAFREQIAVLKNKAIENAGKLEFAESDARMRLAQIQLQQIENQTFAAQLKKFEIELETMAQYIDSKF